MRFSLLNDPMFIDLDSTVSERWKCINYTHTHNIHVYIYMYNGNTAYLNISYSNWPTLNTSTGYFPVMFCYICLSFYGRPIYTWNYEARSRSWERNTTTIQPKQVNPLFYYPKHMCMLISGIQFVRETCMDPQNLANHHSQTAHIFIRNFIRKYLW